MKKRLEGLCNTKLPGVLLAVILMIGLLPVPGAVAETTGRISGLLWADGNGMQEPSSYLAQICVAL